MPRELNQQKNSKNIKQWVFAGGHPPNYSSRAHLFLLSRDKLRVSEFESSELRKKNEALKTVLYRVLSNNGNRGKRHGDMGRSDIHMNVSPTGTDLPKGIWSPKTIITISKPPTIWPCTEMYPFPYLFYFVISSTSRKGLLQLIIKIGRQEDSLRSTTRSSICCSIVHYVQKSRNILPFYIC